MKHESLLLQLMCLFVLASTAVAQEIPITTTSDEARALYKQAEDLAERFHGNEAVPLYQNAIALDSNFAMAYLNLAFRQTTNKDFRAYLSKAVAASEKVSEGERLIIQAYQARMNNERASETALWEKLLKLYPRDVRLRSTVGDVFFFTYDESERAIGEYKKAIEIDPLYHPAYNAIGYVYGILGKYDEAEKALRKYSELLPNEANPHDTYAEVLMKQGKFDESIVEYKKSLALDPKFYFSHIGLGMDYVFIGKQEEGRKQFQTLFNIAFNDNDRVQAIDATAKSYLFEGNYEQAIMEQEKNYALSEKKNDVVPMVWNLMQKVEILVEAGKPKDAKAALERAIDLVSDPPFPAKQKVTILRYLPYAQARIALPLNNLEEAREKLQAYRHSADSTQNMSQIRLAHQLAGRIALKDKRYDDALTELQQADQRNAQTLFLTAQVYAAKGDKAKAREFFGKAANFNDMSWEYALVRRKAKSNIAELQ